MVFYKKRLEDEMANMRKLQCSVDANERMQWLGNVAF